MKILGTISTTLFSKFIVQIGVTDLPAPASRETNRR
jgi:hypothetical protein